MARTLGAGLMASARLVLPAGSPAMVRQSPAKRYAFRSGIKCAYPTKGKGSLVSLVSVAPRCHSVDSVAYGYRAESAEHDHHDHGRGCAQLITNPPVNPNGPSAAAAQPDLP